MKNLLLLALLFAGCTDLTNVDGKVDIGIRPLKEEDQLVHIYTTCLNQDISTGYRMNFTGDYAVVQIPVNGCIVSVLSADHEIITVDTIYNPVSYNCFEMDHNGKESGRMVYTMKNGTH